MCREACLILGNKKKCSNYFDFYWCIPMSFCENLYLNCYSLVIRSSILLANQDGLHWLVHKGNVSLSIWNNCGNFHISMGNDSGSLICFVLFFFIGNMETCFNYSCGSSSCQLWNWAEFCNLIPYPLNGLGMS